MITTKTLYLQKGPSGKEKDVEVSTYVLKTVMVEVARSAGGFAARA